MRWTNGSGLPGFLLMGFSDRPQLELVLFVVILICEVPVLIKLACVDTTFNEAELFVASVLFLLVPVSFILGSYGLIARAVLGIASAAGRRKAFGTCSSHLLVVVVFYGTIIFMYLQPAKSRPKDQGKFVSLFYTVVTPVLNPLIYTLRNKDVKAALWRALENVLGLNRV